MKAALKLKNLIAIIGAFVLLLFIFAGISRGGVFAVSADTDYLDCEVVDDLKRLKLDGKEFDVSDYPADRDGAVTLLYLNEVCYSSDKDKCGAYALFVYIYNPAQLNIGESGLNKLQVRIGNSERFDKYTLRLYSISSDKLYAKYRVMFDSVKQTAVLNSLDSVERRYEISSIELYHSGYNAEDFSVGKFTDIYIFKGEGDDLSCTLNYTFEGGTEVVPLSVKHTSWRPEGTNGKSEYTQDSLTSVYFAVPKELDDKYDYLKSVHCSWLEAQTGPMLVTDNDWFIERMNYVMNKNSNVDELPPNSLDYSGCDFVAACPGRWHTDGIDTADWFGNNNNLNPWFDATGDKLNVFCYMKSDDSDMVSSERVLNQLQSVSDSGLFYNDKAVVGKYPSWLFSYFESEFHDHIIDVNDYRLGESDEKLYLYSEKIGRTLWERFIGKSHTTFLADYSQEEVKVIRTVTSSDLFGTDEQIASRLFVGEYDVPEFKQFVKANEADCEIYLMRIGVSDYYRVPVTLFDREYYMLGLYNVKEKSTHSYVARETVYLDFDIIDFEYRLGDESHIVPVTMSPIDIIPALTPPPFEDYPFWKVALMIIGGLSAALIVDNVIEKKIREEKVL